ncbi:MAG: hypothetical protein HQK97_04740 [Nitrospirae bacterium]|nr:hypothetical protein [Nitrospirota bacterium]
MSAPIINELSFLGQVQDRSQCVSFILELLNIIKIVRNKAADTPVYASRNLLERYISQGFIIKEFLYGRNTDQKLIVGFIIIVTKGPYFEDLLDKIDHKCVINLNDNDVSGSCIAAAAHMSGFLVSLKNSGLYGSNPIEVKYKEGIGDYQIKDIPNIIDAQGAEQFVAKNAKREITSWDTFWSERESLFPKLVFCDCVKDQLTKVNYFTYSTLVFRHLKCINDYLGTVPIKDHDYTKMGVEASIESKITLYHYGHKREFDCPDRIRRRFTWHSKLYGQNIRIHFFPPESLTDKFLIGYIGKHLPTMSDTH